MDPSLNWRSAWLAVLWLSVACSSAADDQASPISGAAGAAGMIAGGGSASGGTMTLVGGATMQVQGGAPMGGNSSAGSAQGGTSSAGAAGLPSSEGTLTFVAVGYAGRRIRSTDGGETWTDDQELGGGGDDEFLLRGVHFAEGVFVAVGWKIVTSPDGADWTEQDNPRGQWLGGVQFGNSRFVATGGYGYSAYSPDGIAWQAGGGLQTQASRSLIFAEGMFVSATDPGNWWQSADGEDWSQLSGGHGSPQVTFCDGALSEPGDCTEPHNGKGHAFVEGIHIRRASGGRLERSVDGGPYQSVVDGGPSFEDVTFGYLE